MIKPKRKTCECGYEGFFTGKKCNFCRLQDWNKNRAKAKVKATKSKPKKRYVYKRKATGESDVFRSIWLRALDGESGPTSFVSGRSLGTEAFAWFFSHVLDKNNYEEARLDEVNIVLMTLEEHTLWEYHQYKLIDDPKWKHVFELKHKLLLKYGYSIPPDEERIYKED